MQRSPAKLGEAKFTSYRKHDVEKKILFYLSYQISTYLFVYCFSEILGLPITTNSISNRPYYYTCQCKLGYGYENCTETSEDAGSINFGYTFCELDNDNVTIIPASESLPLIFIDHVAYGSPLENPTPDSKCQNYYATSIDKVR